MMRRVLIPALLLAAAAPAEAAHKYLPPLTGLVPADFTLTESQAPWLPEALATKSLAVVVSGNVDATVVDWRRTYSRSPAGSPEAQIGAAIEPSIFIKRVINQLRPKFATMTIVPDIATARRQKADYIAIIDYDINFRTQLLKTYQIFHGGVLMLDGNVARVFTAEAEGEVRSNSSSLLKLDFGSIDPAETTATYTRVSDQVAAQLDAKLR